MTTLFLMLRLIRRRWFLISLNVLLHIIRMCTLLAPALAIRACLDILTGEAEAEWSYQTWVLILLASQFGRYINVFAHVAADTTLVYDLGGRLRRNLMREILRRPGADALVVPIGQTISRLRDDVGEVTNLVKRIDDMIGRIVFCSSAVAIMLSINSRITLLVIGPMFVFFVLIFLFGRLVQRYHLRMRQAAEGVSELLGEVFGSVQAIQAADAIDSLADELVTRNNARRTAAVQSRMIWEGIESLSRMGFAIGTGAILLLATHDAQSGSFTVGDITLFIHYMDWLLGLTGHIGNFILEFKKTSVSLNRLSELAPDSPKQWLVSDPPNSSQEIITKKPDTPPNLSIHRLTHTYGTTSNGIREATLEIPAGNLTVITGSMGSGKTTLLKSILGLLPIQSGEIRWNEKLVSDPAHFFVPPRCAYVSQNPKLFSGSLSDNISLGLEPSEQAILNAIQHSVLDHDVQTMPEGLATMIGPRGLRLSGGQIQRTAMARALVRQPQLLVLDDLSSALDVEVEQELLNRLLNEEHTILAVSHRPRVLERAASVILLQDGLVAAQADLKTLIKTNNEMQRLWQAYES